MSRPSGTLRVRNEAQKVLWDCELRGQLSDGMWENASPSDHWQQWCHAVVVVSPDHVGRDFWVKRTSYGFTRKAFLDEGFDLAGRAMSYVRVWRVFGDGDLTSTDTEDVRSRVDYAHLPSYTDSRTREWVLSIGQDKLRSVMADESIYGRKQLIKDLADLSRIMKVGP